MRDLLERWAAAGERTTAFNGTASRILPPVLGDQWSIAHSNQLFRIRAESLACRTHILAATIEAIDSRKWTWSLQGPRKHRAEHMGFVYHPKREDGPPWKVRSGGSPAEALLTAYLAALEAEAA